MPQAIHLHDVSIMLANSITSNLGNSHIYAPSHVHKSRKHGKTESSKMAKTHLNLETNAEVKSWLNHTEMKVTTPRTFKPLDLGK